jgi:hypothetical protein
MIQNKIYWSFKINYRKKLKYVKKKLLYQNNYKKCSDLCYIWIFLKITCSVCCYMKWLACANKPACRDDLDVSSNWLIKFMLRV